MTLDSDEVRKFVREFRSEYDEETILSDIITIEPYEGKFEDLNYYQIGRRTGLPIRVVNDGFHEPVIKEFVNTLTSGERNYVLNKLHDMAEENEIKTLPIETMSYQALIDWSTEVHKADHLFLPLDGEYHSTVLEWDTYSARHRELVGIGNTNIEVHWVPLKTGIENGFLLNSNRLKAVQKFFDNVDAPTGFEHDEAFDDFNKNMKLMLYFGNKTYADTNEDAQRYQTKVDFLYKIVISRIIRVLERSAIMLEPQKELSTTR